MPEIKRCQTEIVSFVLLLCAIAWLPVCAEELSLQWEGNIATIVDDTKTEIMRFRIAEYLIDDDPSLSFFKNQNPSPNPTGRYFVYVVPSTGRLDLIQVDLRQESVKRIHVMDDLDQYYLRTEKIYWVRWIADVKIDIAWGGGRGNTTQKKHIICNVENGAYSVIEGGPTLCFDSTGDNYASLWGDDHSTSRLSQPTVEEMPGTYLRYNGHWVYPRPLRGFINLSERDIYYSGRGAKEFPDLQPLHYGLDRHYVMSRPIFIADTDWVGFIEETYEINKPEHRLESNIVLVNASEAKTNPPRLEDVQIVKSPIPAIGIGMYHAFSQFTGTFWNDELSAVEIWECKPYQAGRPGERVRLLRRVPLDLVTMEFSASSLFHVGKANFNFPEFLK